MYFSFHSKCQDKQECTNCSAMPFEIARNFSRICPKMHKFFAILKKSWPLVKTEMSRIIYDSFKSKIRIIMV